MGRGGSKVEINGVKEMPPAEIAIVMRQLNICLVAAGGFGHSWPVDSRS